jgi:hypothetical protein
MGPKQLKVGEDIEGTTKGKTRFKGRIVEQILTGLDIEKFYDENKDKMIPHKANQIKKFIHDLNKNINQLNEDS